MAVQPGLCRTWSETPKTRFLMARLNNFSAEVVDEYESDDEEDEEDEVSATENTQHFFFKCS